MVTKMKSIEGSYKKARAKAALMIHSIHRFVIDSVRCLAIFHYLHQTNSLFTPICCRGFIIATPKHTQHN